MKKDVPIKLLLLLVILSACSFSEKAPIYQSNIHFTLDDANLERPVELLFYKDKYHLFYQYTKDTQMNWGHVTSNDMMNWENVASVFPPSTFNGLISGSIIIDWNNTLENGTGSLLAFCIDEPKKNAASDEGNKQDISILYSEDGSIWKSDKNHKVILESFPEEINDIKIFWHEDTQRWIMLILSSYSIRMYSSIDLVNWNYESLFESEGLLENGDAKHIEFFPVEVEGTHELKWILLISVDSGSPNETSGIQYFTGDFDGHSFICEQQKTNWIDSGSDDYAGVCLSNYRECGKPLFYLGLIYSTRFETYNENTPEKNYFTIPRMISLVKKHSNYLFRSNPVNLPGDGKKIIKAAPLSRELILKNEITTPQEIDLSFDVSSKLYFEFPESFGIQLSGINDSDKLTIGYYSREHYFFISEQVKGKDTDNMSFSKYIIDQPSVDIKIIIDYPVVEMFAMDGTNVLTQRLNSSESWDKKKLYTEGGSIKFEGGSLRSLTKK